MKIVKKELMYEGNYLNIVDTYFQDKGGRNYVWETVQRKNTYKKGAVVIVALTEENELILERNWRAPIGSFVIQFPAGLTDKKGESEKEAAKRELLEETGFKAKKLIPIISTPLCPALATTEATYFFAQKVEFTGKQNTEDIEKIEVLKIPREKIYDFIFNLPKDTQLDLRVLGILWILERKKLI